VLAERTSQLLRQLGFERSSRSLFLVRCHVPTVIEHEHQSQSISIAFDQSLLGPINLNRQV